VSFGVAPRALLGPDLLLNVGGVCWLPEFLLCRRRAIVDMDPLFTQVGRIGVAAPEDHQVHFSYGVNIGRVGCTVPTVGIDWIPTVPPVVLELWEGAHVPADAPFTTIANWSSYGAVTYRGEHYGQKDEELLRLLDLPTRTSQRLELALVGVETEVTNSLRRAGWLVRNAGEVSSDLATYRAYVTGCRGELSAAKHAYVKTHSGWFSDRSVCYLAAGLPVVLQDTGFGDWLPTGQGVLAFSSVDEAADCIERVRAGYTVERRAAREIAEEHFDARRVLTHLLERAMEA